MPSHADRRARARLCVVLAALGAFAFASSNALAQSAGEAPTDQEIAAAVEALVSDPNLNQKRTARTLRWVSDDRPQHPSELGRWIVDFFVWLGQLSRALVWVVGGLLALGLVWLALRLFRQVKSIGIPQRVDVPTHVRELDIRPESLPDDIGAAALELWRGGEHRAALALLYRGLLSRLAHAHEVPIRDSSTEGDCLALASRHLPPARQDYVAQLIGVWQRAIYGGREPAAGEIEALCAGFDAALTPTGGRAA